MDKSHWMPTMPMNLQLFAEGADSDAGASGEDGAQDSTEGADKAKGKTFSQEDVNGIAAKEAKKAREKLLKDLGLDPNTDPKDYKERLGKFKEYEDAQKTDLDKATGSVATLTKERDESAAKATLLERKFEAVSKGVPADKADKYVKLAESYLDGDDADFGKALDAALKDFPIANVTEKKGSAGAGANPPPGGAGAKLNFGQQLAQGRKEQLKRSEEAMKHYQPR